MWERRVDKELPTACRHTDDGRSQLDFAGGPKSGQRDKLPILPPGQGPANKDEDFFGHCLRRRRLDQN